MSVVRNSALGLRLWKARKASGKSIVELSDDTGISKRSIGYYESGECEPKASNLAKICKSLGVSSDWLLGLEEESCQI